MPLDALFLSAAADELRKTVIDARVDKLQQPEKDVLILTCRGREANFRLLISAGHGSARVHITEKPRENPDTPPMFCMLLRKHLTGARITDLIQPHLERIYLLRFACYDEMGLPCEKTLIAEMMGRSTNIILADGEGRIVDCLYRTDAEQDGRRSLLPGLFYRMPPPSVKRDPYEIGLEEFGLLYSSSSPGESADTRLVDILSGISPLFAREAVFSAFGSDDLKAGQADSEKLYHAVKRLTGEEKRPVMLLRDGKPYDLYCIPVRQYGTAVTAKEYNGFSSLLDDFYTERERAERLSQRCRNIVREVKNRRERAAKKLALRTAELEAAANREQFRRQGDLIKANIYRMQRGMSVLKAVDYYSENGDEIEIPLDVRLSPQQNAAKYYKAYSKAKNAEKLLGEQKEQARCELEYLESVLEELERIESEKDIEEISEELVSEGYLKDKSRERRKKAAQPKPMQFRSPSGAYIYAGRSNIQNDWLTLKFAGKNWLWFHARNIHGAHVVTPCAEDDEATIRAAALVAAYYSKSRSSANVPVDFTRVKYVKKPAGARAGMVIYTDQKTVFVTPGAEMFGENGTIAI